VMFVVARKEAFRPPVAMSALPPKADMCGAARDVRYGPKADICSAKRHVRFTPESGHSSQNVVLYDKNGSTKPLSHQSCKTGSPIGE